MDVKRENWNEDEITIPCPDPNRHWIRVNLKRSVISHKSILISERYPVHFFLPRPNKNTLWGITKIQGMCGSFLTGEHDHHP